MCSSDLLINQKEFDHYEFGRLLFEHHKVLSNLLGTSTPKIDKMIEVGIEAGAYGGKIKKRVIRKHLSELDLPEKKNLKAIAIKYNVEKDRAPKITATGKGAIAEQILKVAEDNSIPFYEDTQLTNLLSKLEIDSEVPKEMFTIVAEILAFVYQLENMSKKRKQVQQKYSKKK